MKKFLIWMIILSALFVIAFIRIPKFNQASTMFATVCNTSQSAQGSLFSAVDQNPGTYFKLDPASNSYEYIDSRGDVAAKILCDNFPTKVTNVGSLVMQLDQTTFTTMNMRPKNYSISILSRGLSPSWGKEIGLLFTLLCVWGFVFLVRQVGKK